MAPSPLTAQDVSVRRYFGTDGVRGVVGETLTPSSSERLGRAMTLWSGRARVLVGRTRASGPELEDALARGIVSAGGTAVLAGVLPTPAVALLAQDLGAVVSASHNPPEYNGVKIFDREGRKLTDAEEEDIEALFDAPVRDDGSVEQLEGAGESYLNHVVERFGSDLGLPRRRGLRERRVLRARARRLRDARRAGDDDRSRARRHEHQRRLRRDGPRGCEPQGRRGRRRPRGRVRRRRRPCARGRRAGETLDGDQILAILAPALGIDLVAVTVMTNLGFHRLMDEHGIRVVTTAVGDRYVLEALRAEAVSSEEQSGHILWLRDHVTGDGLAAALLLCSALGGRTLSEAAGAMKRYPQAKENVRVARRPSDGDMPQAIVEEADRLNAEPATAAACSCGLRHGARRQGAAEAATEEEAARISATIAALVARELSAKPDEGTGRALTRFRGQIQALSGRGLERRTQNVCGIIGYVGSRKCKAILLQGLERLEYGGTTPPGSPSSRRTGSTTCGQSGTSGT